MLQKEWIWIIVAIVLILTGAITFVTVMSIYNWDFKKLSTEKIISNSYEIKEEFASLKIEDLNSDIVIKPSADGRCTVAIKEHEKVKHVVKVENEVLKISTEDSRKWYEHMGIYVEKLEISVYLPEKEYSALIINGSTIDVCIDTEFNFDKIDVTMSTGDIALKNFSADEITLTSKTGDIKVSDVVCSGNITANLTTGEVVFDKATCKSLYTNGNTGDLTLKNVIASEKFEIERTTGDVNMDKCDASEIAIRVSTGDVNGTLLSGKDFVVKSNTGDIDVPESAGGKCSIKSKTGNIKIEIEG